MRTENSGGDVLARGGVKATFQTASVSVTAEKWESIFGDFDAEAYKRGSNSNVPSSGNVGADTRKDILDDSGC